MRIPRSTLIWRQTGQHYWYREAVLGALDAVRREHAWPPRMSMNASDSAMVSEMPPGWKPKKPEWT